MKEGGWPGLDMPEQYGGQNMPTVIGSAIGELFSASNQAFTMYQGLTHGAACAILAHGTDAQKDTFLPNMVSCEWTGTMNLTEPHCGTDLGLLKSKAVPNGDGSYKISGQKIFISAGEHDLTDNIIHLVLARIEGAPEGVKGISLFIVPKFLINEDGSLGERNGVTCGSIEEKMGIHANSTCVLNYDEAKGWLLGEENKGLKAMFTMMNEARLGVGLQGMAISEVSYQNGAAYAKDRLQGRALTGPAQPDKPADPLLVHPDGHGYMQEWGMEQFVRDARIAMIYEGANGIQALDLVGRKLMKDGGRAWQAYFAEIDEFIADNQGNDELKPFLDGLALAKGRTLEATQWMGANAMANFNNAGASSMDYLGAP